MPFFDARKLVNDKVRKTSSLPHQVQNWDLWSFQTESYLVVDCERKKLLVNHSLVWVNPHTITLFGGSPPLFGVISPFEQKLEKVWPFYFYYCQFNSFPFKWKAYSVNMNEKNNLLLFESISFWGLFRFHENRLQANDVFENILWPLWSFGHRMDKIFYEVPLKWSIHFWGLWIFYPVFGFFHFCMPDWTSLSQASPCNYFSEHFTFTCQNFNKCIAFKRNLRAKFILEGLIDDIPPYEFAYNARKILWFSEKTEFTLFIE
jgi:hypothetical protein